MGSNTSLTYKIVEPGTKVYYSSAKFREAQIYQLIHNEPLVDFPTSSCFFVTESYATSLLYSKVIQQPKIFFQNSDQQLNTQSHDVTHTYLIKGRQTTVQLNDPATLRYILFDDSTSPFHLTKADTNLLSIDIFSTRGTKGWPSLKAFEIKHKVPIAPGSGFALILGATNYMNYELYGDAISRVSFYELDFLIIKLLRKYLVKVNSNIQGWCQPAEKFFHQEYMFFDPAGSLIPDYEDPDSWLQKVTIATSYPKAKQSFLSLMKIGEDRLSNLKTTYEKDLAFLYRQARKLSNGEAVANGFNDMIEANLELQQEIIHKEERLFKENTLTHLVPYLSHLYKLRSKYNQLQEIFFIDNKVRCHLEVNCVEPFGFERCQQNLKSLADQMRLYVTLPSKHHKSNTVADHAIWVARTIHKWFQYEKHPWTEHIWHEFQNITLLAAFLHDIGKVGDLDFYSLKSLGVKPDHPFKGYEYILSKLLFKVLSKDERVSHHNLLDYLGCTFNKVDVTVLALVIALHHYFGQLLMTVDKVPISRLHTTRNVNLPFSLNKNHYKIPPGLSTDLITTLDKVSFKQVMFLHRLLKYLEEVDHDDVFIRSNANLVQLVHIIFAVSAADTYGAFPVDLPKRQKDDIKVLEPEFLYEPTSNPQVSVIIDRPFYKYLYHTIGLQQKYIFLMFISKVVNLSLFLSAWDNFNRFIRYLQRCLDDFITVEVLPYPYTHLRQDSLEVFLDDLYNLLEMGNVNEQVSNRVLAPVLGLEVSCELNDTLILEEDIEDLLKDPLEDLLKDPLEDLPKDPLELDNIILELNAKANEPYIQHLDDNLTLKFKDDLLRVITYGKVQITLEKDMIDSVSLIPDINLAYKVYDTTLSSLSLRYVQAQAFSIQRIQYVNINYLSDLIQVMLTFTRSTIVYENVIPDEGPLLDLLRVYRFDVSQTPPVRTLEPIIGTFTKETNSITLCISQSTLSLLRNSEHFGKDDQLGFFEVDQTQGDQVTLNASRLNFLTLDSLDHRTFLFKVSNLMFTPDDLTKAIMSYVQGPTSTLMMFLFSQTGMWNLSLTTDFQGVLITIRDLIDYATLDEIITQVKLWYNRHRQRLTNNFTFLDAITNLTGKDLRLSKVRVSTLFKVTFVPWNALPLDERVHLSLEYKIDLKHNIGPLFTPTFKSNLLMRLLFQTP
jgi:hypothetical protein